MGPDRTFFWLALVVVGAATGLGYVLDLTVRPDRLQVGTHALDGLGQPSDAKYVKVSSRDPTRVPHRWLAAKVRETVGDFEAAGLAGLTGLALLGPAAGWMLRRWDAAPAPAVPAAPPGPAPAASRRLAVFGAVAVGITLAVPAAYAYYPPPEDVLMDMHEQWGDLGRGMLRKSREETDRPLARLRSLAGHFEIGALLRGVPPSDESRAALSDMVDALDRIAARLDAGDWDAARSENGRVLSAMSRLKVFYRTAR